MSATSPAAIRNLRPRPWLPATWSMSLAACLLGVLANAANITWTGQAPGDARWSTPANWGGTAPTNGDALFFAGNLRCVGTNDFGTANAYAGLTFVAGSGAFTLYGNAIQLNGPLASYSFSNQAVALDLRFTNLTVLVTNNGKITLNGGLYATNGGLTKLGQGTLALNGPNSCPTGTVIKEGVVKLSGVDRLGAPGAPLTLDGGTLEAADIVNLSTRPVTLGAGGGIMQVDSLSTLTVAGAISGTGNLTKFGTGTLIVGGSLTSSGSAIVQAGFFRVDGAIAGPSRLTVYSGATLAGRGSILSDVFIADGATLAPGTNDSRGPATLTFSNLALSANSIVRMDLNAPGVTAGTNDFLVVHGDLTLDGILKTSGNGTNGVYPLIRYEGRLIDHGMQLGPAVTGNLIIDTTNKLISLNATAFPAFVPTPMRLLFIGNSLTLNTDIPGTVAQLAAAAGDWFAYGQDAMAGTTLTYHDTNGIAIPLVDSGNFDVVMLQEYSNRPTIPGDRTNFMYPAVRDFNAHARQAGARIMLYETWGYPQGDPANCANYGLPPAFQGCSSAAMVAALRMGYAGIANELNATISPVGLAWQTVMNERPDLNLYDNSTGDYHMGYLGNYLIACSHYAAIFGRSPVGNPFIGTFVPPDTAAYLQTVAERTVLQNPWATDPYGFTSNRFYWAFQWKDYTNQSFSRLTGTVISGGGGRSSPAVRLDAPVGQTNNLYIGVYGYNYELAGQGRLFLANGASLQVTNAMVVGKEGAGWVFQNGGNLNVSGTLTIAEQPSSAGSYVLSNGCLYANSIQSGLGSATFAFGGGQLAFSQFGAPDNPFDLVQAGGTLALTNPATIFGNYVASPGATLAIVGGGSGPSLVVNGNASLDGTLSISFPAGFYPQLGQSITVLTAASISGTFPHLTLPAARLGNLAWIPLYSADSLVLTLVNTSLDSTGSGLPDWWQLKYFGALNSGQTAVTRYRPDALPNSVTYALGWNPTLSVAAQLQPRWGLLNGWPCFSYNEPAGGTGVPGVNYTYSNVTFLVQYTTNLLSGVWLSGTNWIQAVGPAVNHGDGTETATIRPAQPLTSPGKQFFRFRILY